jgi:hypothetical protein
LFSGLGVDASFFVSSIRSGPGLVERFGVLCGCVGISSGEFGPLKKFFTLRAFSVLGVLGCVVQRLVLCFGPHTLDPVEGSLFKVVKPC